MENWISRCPVSVSADGTCGHQADGDTPLGGSEECHANSSGENDGYFGTAVQNFQTENIKRIEKYLFFFIILYRFVDFIVKSITAGSRSTTPPCWDS